MELKEVLLKRRSVRKFTEEQKDQVIIDYENMKDVKYEIIASDLLTTNDGTIKHDSFKLSSLIFQYVINLKN